MSIDVNAIEQTVVVTAVGDEVNVNIIDQPVLVSVTDQIIEVEASGAAGPQGPVGAGVAAGGVTGQVLSKLSNTNYDTVWVNAGAGTVYSVNASGSTGISVTGGPITGAGTLTITNTAPDQVVSLTGGGTTTITGTYPNFTISSTDSTVGTVTSVNMTVPTGLTISGNPITSAGTLALALASGYSIPTTASQATWDAAYNDKINSAAVTGTTTKTLTLNQQDGGTVTASWTDINTDAVTSVFGRTGAVVATGGDYTTSQVTEVTNLYYTEGRVSANTDVAANTAARHNAVTLGTANGLSLSTQALSLGLASGSTTGALSSTDWTTFNNKQVAGNYITALTGEVTASGPGSVAATLLNSAVIGKLLTGLNLAGGGTISATDSILIAFGKTQNQISALVGGVNYDGVWNASTNSPAIVSSVGSKGDYYVVNVAGSTNIDGITDWKVGDWIIFNGTVWDKVDNTDAVSSVNGFTGAVSLTTANISEVTNLYYTDVRARAAVSLTVSGSSGASTYNNSTGVFNIPTYTLSGLGGVPSTRSITINGTAFDLSADRSYSVGTVTSITLATGTTGTDVNVSNGTITTSGTITLNIPDTSATARGLITTGIQTIAGAKTFSSSPTVPSLYLSDMTAGTGALYYNVAANRLTLANYNASGILIFEVNGGNYAMQLNADLTARLNGYTTNGFVKFGSSNGTLVVDTTTYTPTTRSISTTSPLVGGGDLSADRTFSIPAATTSVNGYLTSTDFTTFNNKQNTITLTTTGTSGASTLIGATLNIPDYGSALTGYVPYTGATANVDLGVFDLTADLITGATGSFASSGGSDTFAINHSSGSGIALNITKGGNGEGLYINKTSGSGNAATIVGTLNATTLVKNGGTSSQFLKADGTVDSSTYYLASNPSGYTTNVGTVTSVAATAGTGITISGSPITTSGTLTITNSAPDQVVALTASTGISVSGTYPNFTITNTSPSSGGTVTSVGLSSATSGVTIGSTPITTSGTITLAIATATTSQNGLLSSTDWATFNAKQNAITLTTTGTSGAATLVGSTLNIPQYADQFVGTVTSVAALTLGTTGTDLSSTVANGTTTPVITLQVPTASATNRGALSSADWTTFNNKQSTITNPVTGTGTTNYLPKFTGASTIGNSQVFDNGTNVGIGTTSPVTKLSLGGYNGQRLPYINGTSNSFNANGITVSSSNTGNTDIGGGIDLTNNVYSVGAYSPIISFSSLGANSAYNNSYAGIWGVYQGAGGDPNWGIGDLALGTADVFGIKERMRITSGGNVGIGTTSPTAKLQITSTSAGAATVAAFLVNESVTTNTEVRLAFAANTNNDIATNRYSYISAINTSGSNGQALIFATNESGNSAVERLRIASTGAATFSSTLGINGVADSVKSGTYTPTLAAVYNVASSGSYVCQYMRVGSVVTVSGAVEFAATAANTWTRISISLPISSTFDASFRAGGGGAASATNNVCGIQAAAFSGTVVHLDSNPNTTGNLYYTFSFTYLIM